MSISVRAHDLGLEYPVYSTRAQSLRNAILEISVGGRLMKTKSDVTVVRALHRVNFELVEGDRLGLIGHNGSGKTSLLKVLAGVYSPTTGDVTVEGRVTSMLSMSIGLEPDASGIRNIYTLLMMQGLSRREIVKRIPRIVEFSGLGAFIYMPFKTYSAGMMARLTFAVGTDMEADILLMDEWLSAGDANFRSIAAAHMEQFVGSAKMLIFGTHDFDLVKRLCNKVLILEAGNPTFFGLTSDWIKLPS